MTPTLYVLLILALFGAVLVIREVVQFYRWTDHVRRVRSDYLLGNLPDRHVSRRR